MPWALTGLGLFFILSLYNLKRGAYKDAGECSPLNRKAGLNRMCIYVRVKNVSTGASAIGIRARQLWHAGGPLVAITRIVETQEQDGGYSVAFSVHNDPDKATVLCEGVTFNQAEEVFAQCEKIAVTLTGANALIEAREKGGI